MTDRQWQNFVHAVREIVEQAPNHADGWRGVKGEFVARIKRQDDYTLEEFFEWFDVNFDTEIEDR